MTLTETLNRTAFAIIENGTHTERHVLNSMAAAAAQASPDAAAALIDWNASEVFRLRAFGVVHGVLLRDTSESAQTQLLAVLVEPHTLVLAA